MNDPLNFKTLFDKYKKEHQVKKLNSMDSYCMSTKCLRNELQAYFDHEEVECNFCSICLNEDTFDLDLKSKLSFEVHCSNKWTSKVNCQ